MIILKKDRRKGKTTRLVQIANKEWKYIICRDEQRVKAIMETAKKLNLDIPYPVIVKELPLRSVHIDSVLVDDIEDVLEYIIRKPIDFATTSSNIDII